MAKRIASASMSSSGRTLPLGSSRPSEPARLPFAKLPFAWLPLTGDASGAVERFMSIIAGGSAGVAVGQHHSTEYRVLELADVAGPAVGREQAQRLAADAADAFSLLGRDT